MATVSRLVVLGSGFAGYSLLYHLRKRAIHATLISPRNYFLFTPLLPSAVTGSVEIRSILEPVRRRLRSVHCLEAEAVSVDFKTRQVLCRSSLSGEDLSVPYDDLVIAVGAAVADYGIPGVREHAIPMVSVDDARAIRRGVLEQFAKADLPGLSEQEVRHRLSFVICGAGPTGVEVAAELEDLLDDEVRKSYPDLAPFARVVLLEAGERVLRGFDEALSDYAQGHFRREGIDLRLGAKVQAIEPSRVILATGEELPSGLVIWAGGNTSLPFIERLGEPLGEGRRLLTDAHLRLSRHPNVYALGDCASPVPSLAATAQVAQQQGKYLARALRDRAAGKLVEPFRFERQGMLAYIGGHQAIADLPQFKWSGRVAWFFWRSVYLTKLVSLSNKIKVLFDWAKSRLLGRDLSRF